MDKIAFCSIANSQVSLKQVLTLVASLRDFGGRFAASRFCLMVPKENPIVIPVAVEDPLVEVVPFDTPAGDKTFPLFQTVAAAAAAEAMLDGKVEMLAWMTPETLIIQEPSALLLDPGKSVGGRPVDMFLIGPRWDEPLDPFWAAIFGGNEFPKERFVKVLSSVGHTPLKNHLNCGLVMVRPEKRILRGWWNEFAALYKQPLFEEYYKNGDYYQVLLPQAALTGAIFRAVEPSEVQIFPELVSYPTHMHTDYPVEHRPAYLNDVITARYYLEDDEQALQRVPAKESLKAWLGKHLG